MTERTDSDQISIMMDELGHAARTATVALSRCSDLERNSALQAAAELIRQRARHILAANDDDMQSAKERGLGAAMLDRLELDDARTVSASDASCLVSRVVVDDN